MNTPIPDEPTRAGSTEAPGKASGLRDGLAKLALGLAGSVFLTLASFWAAGTDTVYGPGIPILLGALAIGQMGLHLVCFLHVSSGPEGTNNILALAFGVFVVALLVFGSIVIMTNLDANMPAAMPAMPAMGT